MCNIMRKYKVFNFSNQGECVDVGKPYTFDNSQETIT